MYAIALVPLLNLTLATLRLAEFGFLGVCIYTLVQTAFRCGDPSKILAFFLLVFFKRGFLIN
jgi:hypothetical protein